MKVLVTGWSSGIGRALAEMLEQDGLDVLRFDGRVENFDDWTKYRDLEIDGLVNCAGIMSLHDIFGEKPEEYERVMRVNCFGPIYGMKTVLPGMVGRDFGRVVNVTSVYAADSGNGIASAYHASKAALSMASRNAAKSVARYSRNVTVNEVRPGFTRTPMTSPYYGSEAYRDYVHSKTLMKRLGEPNEVAKVIRHLLSHETFVTGASWAVDGGWLT